MVSRESSRERQKGDENVSVLSFLFKYLGMYSRYRILFHRFSSIFK